MILLFLMVISLHAQYFTWVGGFLESAVHGGGNLSLPELPFTQLELISVQLPSWLC